MNRFDPNSYPGSRPDRPVLVWRGRTHALDPHLPGPGLGGVDAPILAAGDERRYVLAYGSNASVDRLLDKGLDSRGILVLPAAAWGWIRAWEARRSTSTGAVPLTLVRGEGCRLDGHVLGVHPDDLDRLDASEYRGRNYVLGAIGGVAVAARWRLRTAYAYRPAAATRLLTADDGHPLTYPEHDQAAAVARLDGPTVQVGDRVEPVEGWPSTPLEPLDLFVYGTLQPGRGRWDAIAADCDVVGPASTSGELWDTGRGWPAARFGETDAGLEEVGTVHGTLLRPRGPAAAARLYRAADAIEAEGELFRRVAVRVSVAGGDGWAASYGWFPDRGEPPGRRIADGRWGP